MVEETEIYIRFPKWHNPEDEFLLLSLVWIMNKKNPITVSPIITVTQVDEKRVIPTLKALKTTIESSTTFITLT